MTTDQPLNLDIIYEDEQVVVVNKPPGVVVNSSQTYRDGQTVQDWWENRYGLQPPASDWQQWVPADFKADFGSLLEIYADRRGIAHRLDKDTSGVLLLAKDPGSLANLLAQFKQRTIQKKYLALVHGRLSLEEDRLSLPLGRKTSNRLQWAVRLDGKPAVTDYQVTEKWAGIDLAELKAVAGDKLKATDKKIAQLYQGFSLVECAPRTGRTHQLRVHLAHIRHPIVGDQVYGSEKKRKLDNFWCPRQFLHASQLEFTQPATGKKVAVKAELAEDLQQALSYLI